MGIMGYVEDIEQYKSIVFCDYLFIWNVFWSLCEAHSKLIGKITELTLYSTL